MKTGKKILSVLLALVMALSMAGLAFAEGEANEETYNWVAIPTSADGLPTGAYYLDWAAYAEAVADADAPDDLIVPYLAALNAGEWYIDVDKAALKGTYTIPAGAMHNQEAQTLELTPEASNDVLSQVLKEVGLTWVEVSFTKEGLQDGEYYLDVDAARAKQLRSMYDRIYVNPNGGLMRMQTVRTIPTYDAEGNTVFETERWTLPLQNFALGATQTAQMQELYDSIKQYKAVAEPNDGGKTNVANGFASFWAKVVAFFQSIGDFFRKVFKF